MANIHGLGPVKKAPPADRKNEEFNVGGARSGQAVLRPVKDGAGGPAGAGGAGGGDMADLINAARGQAGNPAVHDKNLCLITVYSNGFQVGKGPFRDSKEAKNQQFLTDLKRGVVPQELEPEVRREWPDAREVGVQLVNKTTQPYVPDKNANDKTPKFDFKAGTGNSLTAGSGATPTSAAAAAFSAAKPSLHVADESQPTTDLQLVTSDRKKTKVKFNQSATVLDVYQHLMALTGLSKFELIGGGGIPKPLTNATATLKDANLLNSSISQRVAPSASGGTGAGRGAGAARGKK